MATSALELAALALPKYLEDSAKEALIAALGDHGFGGQYFGAPPDDPEPIQGDGWRNMVAIDFVTGERDQILGMILSNSCDLAEANDPTPDQSVLFAPILDLALFAQGWREAGIARERVDSMLAAIRQQCVSRLFYLPPFGNFFGESVVVLDSIHAQPLRSRAAYDQSRQFSLSMYGWYVLLIKLSLHFTRMGEAIKRSP